MKQQTSISQKLQKFGAFLAGMVIPNIGAFIGFGLITAFFLETGWTPEERLATLLTPILNNLLPVLIAHTGGKMVGGDRGGVLGAFVTIGAIIAVEGTPMFMAAMILGPFSGWVIRKFDHAIDGKIPGGFEMIVNNFSLGIIGAILCCFAYLIFGPIMNGVTTILTNGVNWIIAHNVLPLTAIFVEPAKVLFLNNALDHGIFGPIGYEQVKTIGHSALFLLVPNPGPGLGLLLAYWIFGKGEMKDAAPGMILIHFFGGIHEVYFPYVLSNPITLIGMIAAGIASTGTLTLLNVGMVATPSPGSIFSVIALSPPDGMVSVLLAVAISCIVSFLLNAIFVKMQYRKNEEITMGEPVIPIEAMVGDSNTPGLPIDVVNYAISKIPPEADFVIVLLTVIVVVGIIILDHFAIKEEKEQKAAMEKARAERRAAKKKEKELATVKVKEQKEAVICDIMSVKIPFDAFIINMYLNGGK